MSRYFICSLLSLVAILNYGFSQEKHFERDSLILKQIYIEALENGRAYEDLRVLCKDIGHRLSGSLAADLAVQWGYNTLAGYNFDTVYLQEVMVPHWVRGTPEKAYFTEENGETHPMNILALGGSVSTNGIIDGEIVMFKRLEELKKADKATVEGKIVFVAERMNTKHVNTFSCYGEAFPLRWSSASIAAEKGAKAVIIRSLSHSENDFPNTGTLFYEEDIPKIPAAALSTKAATKLEQYLEKKGTNIRFYLEMNCQTFPDKLSHNVIAEIKGKKNPNHIITVGGHLDSWDIGEGAHDDGAGIVHSMEALRILKSIGYQPNNTLRVVFFMNEENGNMGGKTYAKKVKEAQENHIYAIESDAGGFSPRGFSVQGNEKHLTLIQSFAPLFKPYFIHYFESGYGGVDIGPLIKEYENIALIGLRPDNQRYFDIHHNANDVFENVNKRELHIGAATISALMYLLDANTVLAD